MKPAFQIILADDHVRFREEIRKIIEEITGIEVMAEVGDGNKLFEMLEMSQPDLILLDISMPNLRAMKATREIKSRYPKVKVIIMVIDKENEYLSHASAAGADGILLKQNSARELTLAIHKIRHGKRYFPRYLEEERVGSDTLRPTLVDRHSFLYLC